jgi:hypothetical protein
MHNTAHLHAKLPRHGISEHTGRVRRLVVHTIFLSPSEITEDIARLAIHTLIMHSVGTKKRRDASGHYEELVSHKPEGAWVHHGYVWTENASALSRNDDDAAAPDT